MLWNKQKKLNIFILLMAVAVVFGLPALAVGEVELHKLTASDDTTGDQFGASVAISGTTALVGAWRDDAAGIFSGSAYLFDVATGSQIAKLTASDTAKEDFFGHSVALSGSTAIVGAQGDDDACPPGERCWSGSAYLFDVSDPCNPVQIAKLTASDAAFKDWFGHFVAISGTTALVGAFLNDDACPGDPECDSGSAYLYDFSDPCNITETKLTASDAAAGDHFGISVAISGNTAIVVGGGSAYLFDVATGSQMAKLTGFGRSVAISGNTAIVGGAYLFDVSDPSNPVQIAKLTASDAAEFGRSVALSGTTALVGAGNEAAYLFNAATGSQIAKLTASDTAAFDVFGCSVALSGTTALVGAPGRDDAGSNSGSAYVFKIPADPVELLFDLTQYVIDLNLQNGIENGLDAKLGSALQALDDVNANNDVAAINTLEAFINAVEAQRGDKILTEDADALIAAAQAIINLLSAE